MVGLDNASSVGEKRRYAALLAKFRGLPGHPFELVRSPGEEVAKNEAKPRVARTRIRGQEHVGRAEATMAVPSKRSPHRGPEKRMTKAAERGHGSAPRNQPGPKDFQEVPVLRVQTQGRQRREENTRRDRRGGSKTEP